MQENDTIREYKYIDKSHDTRTDVTDIKGCFLCDYLINYKLRGQV